MSDTESDRFEDASPEAKIITKSMAIVYYNGDVEKAWQDVLAETRSLKAPNYHPRRPRAAEIQLRITEQTHQ